MRSPILAAVVAAVLVAPAAPAVAEDPIDIDKLIAEYVTARDVAASAVKTAAAKKSILAEAAAVLNKRLADLGVTAPVVPPVPVPLPTDPLVTKFRTAYLAETGPDKAAALADLGELCKQVQGYCVDPKFGTIIAVATKAKKGAEDLLKGRIPGVFAEYKAAVVAEYPFDEPLTDDSRKAMKAFFLRLQAVTTEAGK